MRDAAPAAALREALEAAKARLAEATAEVAKLKAAGPNGAKSFKRYDELLEDNRKLQVNERIYSSPPRLSPRI